MNSKWTQFRAPKPALMWVALALLVVIVAIGKVAPSQTPASPATAAEAPAAAATEHTASAATVPASAPASQSTSAPAAGADEVGRHPLVFSPPPSYAGGEGFWTQMLASVAVILILGGLALVVVKRLLPRLSLKSGAIIGGGKQVRVLETTYIGPRKALHLVQVGDRKLLLAGTGEGVTLLTDVTAAVGPTFADDLKAQQQRQDPETRRSGDWETKAKEPKQ